MVRKNLKHPILVQKRPDKNLEWPNLAVLNFSNHFGVKKIGPYGPELIWHLGTQLAK